MLKITFYWFRLLTLTLCWVITSFNFYAEGGNTTKKKYFYSENYNCLKCHGQSVVSFVNSQTRRMVKQELCDNYIIDSVSFYLSDHGTFKCTDCHAPEYDSFPHQGNLRFQSMWTCLDCHGNDDKYASYYFERIDSEYTSSVHNLKDGAFSCWKCHDPHSYKTTARKNKNFEKVVAYDNLICLKCHGNQSKLNLLTDRDSLVYLQHHDWLPEHQLHFKKVRCIECHTQLTEKPMISHTILNKKLALRNCDECHSKNSILMASLYRYEVPKNRKRFGFLNGQIVKNYYVIGATRNYFLNITSLIIFGFVLLGIAIHIILRIIFKKNKK